MMAALVMAGAVYFLVAFFRSAIGIRMENLCFPEKCSGARCENNGGFGHAFRYGPGGKRGSDDLRLYIALIPTAIP
jgi:hypothetical protein